MDQPRFKFYVYEMWDPTNNEPFYVGKGKFKGRQFTRPIIHIRFAKGLLVRPYDNNHHRTNRIKKILSEGLMPITKIVLETNNENEAFNKEKELIKLYGRRDLKTGSLTNLTAGGDGGAGRVWAKESLEKIKNTFLAKGKYPMSGKKHTPESIQKMKDYQSSRPKHYHSSESKKLIKEKCLKRYEEGVNPFCQLNKNKLRAIAQIDTDGNVIRVWPSIAEAVEMFKAHHIGEALYNNYLAKGYYWRPSDDSSIENGKLKNIEELNYERIKNKAPNSIKISQYSSDGALIKIWDSGRQIKRELNICDRIINDILNGKRKSSLYKNFIWKKTNETVCRS